MKLATTGKMVVRVTQGLTPESLPKSTILGIGVHRLTMAQFLEQIERLLQSDSQQIVATADSSMIYDAQHDTELRDILEKAALVTPDSSGVLWAGSRKGQPFPEKVSGVDLVAKLCSLSSQKGYRIYFLGAAPGVAQAAAEKLTLQYPGCNIVGFGDGFFSAKDDELVAQSIGELNPDILFVAMGIPRQEKFISKNAHLHRAKVAIGVGGSFDVYAGVAKRAPVVIQKARLEWLWRLAQNPSKYKKTLKLPKFMLAVLRHK
ncbi:MAG: WecB/TagA/CpsF family glycosyltransferase [Fimbriimonadaceae bacterium]